MGGGWQASCSKSVSQSVGRRHRRYRISGSKKQLLFAAEAELPKRASACTYEGGREALNRQIGRKRRNLIATSTYVPIKPSRGSAIGDNFSRKLPPPPPFLPFGRPVGSCCRAASINGRPTAAGAASPRARPPTTDRPTDRSKISLNCHYPPSSPPPPRLASPRLSIPYARFVLSRN